MNNRIKIPYWNQLKFIPYRLKTCPEKDGVELRTFPVIWSAILEESKEWNESTTV